MHVAKRKLALEFNSPTHHACNCNSLILLINLRLQHTSLDGIPPSLLGIRFVGENSTEIRVRGGAFYVKQYSA